MIYFVVEGKTDTAKILSIFPKARTIETNGSEINSEKINLIKKISKHNRVIVFTDPDGPGKKIRQTIIENIPNLEHAFIEKSKCIKKKVGIAEAKIENILEALGETYDFSSSQKTITWKQFTDLRFIGFKDSKSRRIDICKKLKISYANGKTLFKWLNMISFRKEDL